ncbi:hypothetical protein [Algoriphagus taiwanensis]|uniref:Uncharacterized protein n=1 Tax=Algoriphagus taiwanensis TaxID=1445656 RepID=A0ABQ6Q1N9_9BACT|nr:hypothetical protein Ataiwa_23660 [Algoriphagus taiwanensis]
MENKALAFDYLKNLMLVNEDADKLALEDTNLSKEDKETLIPLMTLIKEVSAKARETDYLKSESGKKLSEEQVKAQIRGFELNTRNMENTYDTIMSIKSSLQMVVKDATRAYNYIMAMYITAFILGIGLIATSIYFAAQDKTILAIAFGSVGFLDLVTTFFFKPPLEIQNSRSNLSQLMIIITNWFAELMNMNSYMGQRGAEITWQEMKDISDALNESTKKMVTLIEEYSEVRK